MGFSANMAVYKLRTKPPALSETKCILGGKQIIKFEKPVMRQTIVDR